MKVPVSGLINIRNTCFLNTAIQCMICVDPLTEELFRRALEGIKVWEIDDCPEQFKNVKRIGYEMSLVFKGITEEPCIARPTGLYRAFCHILPMYGNGAHHDSHEVFIILMDYLHRAMGSIEKCERPIFKEGEITASLERDRYLYDIDACGKVKSLILDRIFGQELVSIQCQNDGCKKEFHKYPLFTSLPLDLPKKENSERIDLIDCLRANFSESRIESDWRCDKCGEVCHPLRNTKIVKFPDYLVIQLKRFQEMSGILGMTGIAKDNRFVDFSLNEIDLTEFSAKKESLPIKYECVAIANHIGGMAGGHYYAYVRRDDNWFDINDHQISKLSPDKVITNMAYYMVFRKIY